MKISTIRVILWYFDKNIIILQVSSQIPSSIGKMLNAKYYPITSKKPGGTVIKFKFRNEQGITALFDWLAKHQTKWKYMGCENIFKSKKYNKKNIAHLKLGLDAVLEYAKVPEFDAAVLSNATQTPAPTDAVISPNCGAAKLSMQHCQLNQSGVAMKLHTKAKEQ